MRLSIARAASLLAAVAFIAFLATAGAGRYILDELRIGGHVYQKIAAGKDFVADALPPPLSLLEAYLDVELAASYRIDAREAKTRLASLRKQYEERRAFWSKSTLLPAELTTLVKGPAAEAADAFWREIDAFLPALERGDGAGVTASMGRLDASFVAHRAVETRQTDLANAFALSAEKDATLLGDRSDVASLAATIAILCLLAGAGLIAHRHVVRPIVTLADYTSKLARGQILDKPPVMNRSDEIGEMRDAVAIFRDKLEEVRLAETRAAEQNAAAASKLEEKAAGAKWYIENRDFFFSEYTAAMERLAEGDLEVRLEKEFIKDYEKLRARFNTAVERMQHTLRGIVATSGAIGSSTREIARASEDLSQRNEQQAATLAETAAAVDQITGTVRKAAESAVEAREIVGDAKTDAVKGEKIVGEAIDAMSGIEKSSEQIGQIIGVIDEIAFQTNLLALNAGVEAARAGEAGRGFAVVATEVRSLAQRSAEAAKEIKDLIAVSNARVQDGVGLVAETGASLHRIVEQVNRIDVVVTGIAASAAAQSTSLREVNTAVQEIDQVTQKNAAMSEETNAASRSLAEDSAELVQLVARFKIGEIETRAPSAARPMLKRTATSRSSAAVRKPEPAQDEDWTEF
ncbi:methyl-accepting chemotaxis protein [Methylosinus sp. H3A]|uniref:methyl-accepting chemotaxis protein n=1 Tax=Methylosinus sp. H3A TaxID=2785786 RepID=UPI0018C24901|nr:methyl-accepting chemotaxis protein [Methylosinus sp. H3A]MBG0808674.1 methyl-accepting chemotaxis protein [Methylosinus sp. H3A]